MVVCMPQIKKIILWGILCLFFSPQLLAHETETFGKMTSEAKIIMMATVEELKPYPNRPEWRIVHLKTEEVLKGSPPSTLKLLDEMIFPNEPAHFAVSQKVLVFLKELPPYTAWQELIQKGITYQVIGKTKGIISDTKEQRYLKTFVEEFKNALSKTSTDTRALLDLKLRTLLESPSLPLKTDLAQEIFELHGSQLNTNDLSFLSGDQGGNFSLSSGKVASLLLPEKAKFFLARGLIEKMKEGVFAPKELEKFFCSSPATVCLMVAEALESKGHSLPVTKYAEAIGQGSAEIKTGLLTILGRHQRRETYPLFSKTLKETQDEKEAQRMIEALGDLGGEQAETLCLSYAKDSRYYVRLAVIESLGKLKSQKGIWALEAALKTTDPTLVTLAAKSLGQIGTPETEKILRKYYKKEHHGYWEPSGPEHFNPPSSP